MKANGEMENSEKSAKSASWRRREAGFGVIRPESISAARRESYNQA